MLHVLFRMSNLSHQLSTAHQLLKKKTKLEPQTHKKMTVIENNIKILKNDLLQMWALVINQMEKARLALINGDINLAREVWVNEKRVDAFELKIDMDSENVLLLNNPVAIDLRFVLSVLKINYNIERIGDYANGISHIVLDSESPFENDLVKETHINEMFEICIQMI